MLARKRVNSKPHYSIIIKDHMIRFVEMRRPIPYGINRFKEKSLPPGIVNKGKIIKLGELETILKSCVKEWKVKGKKIYFTVPDPIVILRKLELPGDLNDDEIRAHLYMGFGSSIHLPFDEPVFDFHLLFRSEQQTEILFFAAPEQVVKDYVELFEESGTKPVLADVSSLALYRFYYNLDLAIEENIMLVQADINGVNISIFKTHQPFFIRQVATNWLDAYNEDRDTEQDPIYFQDILVEIERTMNFYQFSIHNGAESVNKIVLTGDLPDIESFYSEMIERISLPIDPLFQKSLRNLQGDTVPSPFHVNIGLALKEVPVP